DSYLLFFFFFQAEDGIRDLIVTGVQTCALPISRVDSATAEQKYISERRAKFAVESRVNHGIEKTVSVSQPKEQRAKPVWNARARSEERRVGKECIARRSRCQ